MSYQSGSMNPNASQPATAQVETSQQQFDSGSSSQPSSFSAATFTPSPVPEKSQQPTSRCFGWKRIGNPFPVSLAKRSNRATILAADFLTNSFDQVFVPQEALQSCRGLVFLSIVKGSYLWSGRFGSGVVVARLDNGLWSAPSAINCVGVGYGAQAGLLFTDMVIVLRDENSLGAFLHMGNVTIGASLAAAVGPWGRTGEFSLAATCATAYSLSSTSGLGGGISVEGLVFMEGRKANEKCYGRGATARSILAGHVSPTDEVVMLVSALNERFTNQRRFSASEKPPIYASPEGSVLPNYGSGDKTALIQHN